MVKKSSFIPGMILVFIGAVLMLRRLDIAFTTWEYTYPIILLAIGILFILNGFLRQDSGSAFWGTLLLLFGIFYSLRNFLILSFQSWYWEEFWPILLIIPGVAFIVMFIVRPQDWGVLIPGFLLLFVGAAFLSDDLDPFWVKWYKVIRFWPVIMIVLGLFWMIYQVLPTARAKKPQEFDQEKFSGV